MGCLLFGVARGRRAAVHHPETTWRTNSRKEAFFNDVKYDQKNLSSDLSLVHFKVIPDYIFYFSLERLSLIKKSNSQYGNLHLKK